MADNLDDCWINDDEKSSEGDDTVDPVPTQTKKRKKDSQKKSKKKKKTITEKLKETGDLAGQPKDLVDFLQSHFKDKLAPVEWDELQLDTEQNFYDSNSLGVQPSLYLKSIFPKWKKLKSSDLEAGSPVILIVTSSALRAVQLNREIQDFKGDKCRCAKLFAKHMKLDEQQKFLKKTVCHLGVGTPNRILALLKSGHLHTEQLRGIVLDWNWRDVKQRRLMGIPEIRTDFAELLKLYLVSCVKCLHCKFAIL